MTSLCWQGNPPMSLRSSDTEEGSMIAVFRVHGCEVSFTGLVDQAMSSKVHKDGVFGLRPLPW